MVARNTLIKCSKLRGHDVRVKQNDGKNQERGESGQIGRAN